MNSSGSGTLEFSYDNSYFGTTAVNGGTLSLAASNGLGDSSATATVYAGSLTLSGSSALNIPNALTLKNGTTLSDAVSGTHTDTLSVVLA